MREAFVIFSDIDGTLIDFETYSYAAVQTAVAQLIAHQIPLVLCSSKTYTEQLFYRQKLRIPDPFIVENGSAIFVPQAYFSFDFSWQQTIDEYRVIELGTAVARIRQALAVVRQEQALAFQGYGDLTVAQVSQITGLAKAAAQKAKDRQYSETIVTPLSAKETAYLQRALRPYDLTVVSGGKFHTIMSAQSDKGTAVSLLTGLYKRKLGDIVTVGLGDSANDVPMLRAVQRPFLVQKPGGCWQEITGLDVTKVPAIGPDGWRQVIEINQGGCVV